MGNMTDDDKPQHVQRRYPNTLLYDQSEMMPMNSQTLIQRAKAFDYLFDAVVVTNLQGTIIDWNIGSESLYGYTREEILGKNVSLLHAPEDRDHLAMDVLAAIEKDGRWTGEVKMLHKNGTTGWIESVCIPLMNDDRDIVGALGVNRDITLRKQAMEQFKHLAHYDQLTQIPNRYLLLDRTAHLIVQSQRNQQKFAMLYVDLDGFKVINDAKGHAFGDLLLRAAAERLAKSVRISDTIARIGGDEFVILLENVPSQQHTCTLAETLIKVLSKPFELAGETLFISCSIGIACYPEHGETTDDLLASADKAMYIAKEKGPGNYNLLVLEG